nr:hypothetical protein [Tanacetum cinerariifolium]
RPISAAARPAPRAAPAVGAAPQPRRSGQNSGPAQQGQRCCRDGAKRVLRGAAWRKGRAVARTFSPRVAKLTPAYLRTKSPRYLRRMDPKAATRL